MWAKFDSVQGIPTCQDLIFCSVEEGSVWHLAELEQMCEAHWQIFAKQSGRVRTDMSKRMCGGAGYEGT